MTVVMTEAAKIVTFYSYKGGVGRSMALANVAWLLSTKYGKKVLIVDWDLEAPGLHRFFGIESKDTKPGLINLFEEYKQLLKKKEGPLPEKVVDLKKCLVNVPLSASANGGSLNLICAGKQDDDYVRLVNAFDWNEFYETWHGYGFFEYLKTELKNNAEIVLLDSRTGVTDIGGICTLQLPDLVILLFALNEQNISGTEFIAERILNRASDVSKDGTVPALLMRPARVEKYLEQDKKNEWEDKAAKRLVKYLPSEVKDQPLAALNYIKQNSIPYVGAYGFGELPLASEKLERHADEPVLSFDALAVSILKRCGLWIESYAQELAPDNSISPAAAQKMFIYLVAIGSLMVLLITSSWPRFSSSGYSLDGMSLLGLRVPIPTLWRFCLLCAAGGGLGSCVMSANRLFSSIANRRAAKPSRRSFFLEPFAGMGMSAVFYLVMVYVFNSPIYQFNSYAMVAVSILIGIFGRQLITKLIAVIRTLGPRPRD